jgi:hypothetical protein
MQGAVIMAKLNRYRVLMMGLTVGLGVALSAGVANAQVVINAPSEDAMYCSGVNTDKPVPNDIYLISGEDSRYKTTFHFGDLVYINRGATNGVKVGDQFEVVRSVTDMSPTMFFKYQAMLTRAMGTRYADIGRLRVVHVNEKTSTAEIALGCDLMQRGDILRPFEPRPAPPFHSVKFDPFAAPSGKKTAMIVQNKEYGSLVGLGTIVFVNLGSAQGVQVGDYFRVFRYQGTNYEAIYQTRDTAYKVYGYGSTPVAYQWDNLPRQILGEGIVLRTGPNSSTVLLTTVREEIFIGDYVEIE